jgi:hypothetical protein
MSIRFEKLNVAEPRHDFIHGSIHRAPVPGGWLVAVFYNSGHAGGPAICFYPDPKHEWDGQSLDSQPEQALVHH